MARSSNTLVAVALTVLCSVACGGAHDPLPSDTWPEYPPIELGTRHYITETGAGLVYEIFADPGALLAGVQSDRFDRVGIAAITADYDISEVDELAPEHVLRLTTSTDAEVLSSWSTLRKGGGLGGAGVASPIYKVWLLFEATAERAATPSNGVLELDPAGDALTVEWEYPSTGALERLDVDLPAPPPAR